ncbi:MAG: DUF2157 domain-containing protein [Candidatus Omnitrophica bacterium]|nr:DUF2157 domain-containing protein [Candidatus Omnitrophota bacterium]
MPDDQQIKRWLAEGVITPQQAEKMMADALASRKERTSDRLIVVVSTIGALLLGIGAVLFVAANWEGLSELMKTLVLSGSTFGVSYLGYVLAYERKNFPKVGSALLFLGALLFGATLFLLAQMYHVEANSHLLILLWLIAILPLVYVLGSLPIAGLASVLWFMWIGLAIFRQIRVMSPSDVFALPILYLLSGILLFEGGGIHYLSEALRGVARVYRVAALKVVMAALFLLTFRFFSGHYDGWNPRAEGAFSAAMVAGVSVAAVLAILLVVFNLCFNPSKSSTWKLEGGLSLGVLGLTLLLFFFPSTTNVYTLLFNLVLVGCIAALIGIGYQREDMRVVNIGMSYFALFVLVRYCDWFWKLLPRSIFFMVGGTILVLVGIAFEQKRRQLAAQFAKPR